MRHFPLYVVVFIGGASVLALEILGTRILGPFYGVSLFLWSALITVTLAALSLGYLLGGRIADRGPRYTVLGGVLIAAGIWTLAVPWLKHPILHLTEPLGMRAAVLITSSALFFLPLTLLGMVSPYAIRLRAQRLSEVGRTAGDLYAVSTLASVIAALLTGFVLIPNLGVVQLTRFVGAVLLVAGAVALFAEGRRSPKAVAALVLGVVGGGVAWFAPRLSAQPDSGLIYAGQSPYAELRVVDWDDVRYLLIDGGCHTSVEPGTWHSYYEYVKTMDICKFLYDEPGKLLLLGLGGGSVAKSFHESGWQVDVVEIDPAIVKVAREYFGLKPDEARVTVMDARRFLAKSHDTYDLIVMDAFGSSSIPFHLVTTEAFGVIKDHLAPGGVFAINYEAVGWYDAITTGLGATLRTRFSHVVHFPMAEPRNVLGNLVVMASDREIDFPDEMLGRPAEFLDDDYHHFEVVTRNHAWDNRFEPDSTWGPVLTDDRNPADLWAERINLVARRALHDKYAWSRLTW